MRISEIFFEQSSDFDPSVGYLAQWRITIRRQWLDNGRVCIVTRCSNFPKINLNMSFHPKNGYFSLWFFEQNSPIWPSVGYLAQWRITIRRRWLDDGRVCVVTRRSNFPKINLCRATHLTLLTRRRRRLAASEIRRRRQRRRWRRLFAEWRNWATAAGGWRGDGQLWAAPPMRALSPCRLRVEIVALFLKTNVAPTIGIWCKQHCTGNREFQIDDTGPQNFPK